MCGNPREICQDPDADRANPRAKWIYWALPPYECHIGSALKAGEKEFGNSDKALIPRVKKAQRGTPRPFD